ncbi:Rpn family recombination-promoting nuclease/putative transposase [Treponema pedis]|uniref:Rpn family recombination-promoting nuclease/putative transposase n=1 Tax=Treponema pedis TaxID=409322 RepID=UPI0003FDC0C0|nr:Rpn family recombination-promoting nuclease/putative transposase [Treponema pedis]
MKTFEELTIVDDFIFYHVMQEPSVCKDLINIVLCNKISTVTEIGYQKVIADAGNAKGIRLDVWAKDEKGNIYDIEMQAIDKKDLARRMRYYQSAIDLGSLEKGKLYNDLTDSFIIFFCPFDYLNRGLPIYTFKTVCTESPDILLEDGINKIIVNSKASEKAGTAELKAFLEYMNGKTSKTVFTKKLDNLIKEIKQNEARRKEYMRMISILDEAKYYAIKEGHEQGMAQGIAQGITQGKMEGLRQTAKLMKNNNYDISEIVKLTGLSQAEIEAL